MAVLKKKKAKVVYPKEQRTLKYIGYTKKFAEALGFEVTMTSIENFRAEECAKLSVIFLLNTDNTAYYDTKATNEFIREVTALKVGLVVLGDANKAVLEYMSFSSFKASNHTLDKGKVHNIIASDETVYYMPSNHKYLPDIDNYNILNLETFGSKTDHFLDVIAVSPIREDDPSSEDARMEVEIYSIRILGILGILGSPELLFEHFEDPKSNIAKKSLIGFIKKLVEELVIF